MYVVIFWGPEIHTPRTESRPELHILILSQTTRSLGANTPTCTHFPHVYLDVVTNYVLGRCHLEKKSWSLSREREREFSNRAWCITNSWSYIIPQNKTKQKKAMFSPKHVALSWGFLPGATLGKSYLHNSDMIYSFCQKFCGHKVTPTNRLNA